MSKAPFDLRKKHLWYWHEMTRIACGHLVEGVILDIGGGTGDSFEVLRQSCESPILSIDLEFQSCYIDRPIVGSVENLPISDNSIATVFARSILQYTNQEKSVKEMVRVTRCGGSILIIANKAHNPFVVLFRCLTTIQRRNSEWKIQHYLSPKVVDLLTARCTVQHFSYHLFTPLLYPLISRFKSNLCWKVFQTVIKYEQKLITRLPVLSNLCWYELLIGVKK